MIVIPVLITDVLPSGPKTYQYNRFLFRYMLVLHTFSRQISILQTLSNYGKRVVFYLDNLIKIATT